MANLQIVVKTIFTQITNQFDVPVIVVALLLLSSLHLGNLLVIAVITLFFIGVLVALDEARNDRRVITQV